MIAPGTPLLKFKLKKSFKDQLKSKKVNWGYGGFSEFIFLRTYARKKPDGKLESFADAVIRVIEGMFSILKTHADLYHISWDEKKTHKLAEEAAERLFDMKWSPPGRGWWQCGTEFAETRGFMSLNNCAFVSTKNISTELSKPFAFLMDACMLGVGVGFDTEGAGVELFEPSIDLVEKIVIEDSREGWVDALSCLIDSYLEEDNFRIEFDYSKIRAEGEPIKGFGGTSSGPLPLKQGLSGIRDILSKRANSEDWHLTATDIVDIMCIVGKIVVAGNVRRSALLALGNSDNQEFINMKNWDTAAVETGIGPPTELWDIDKSDYKDYDSKRTEIANKYKNEKWAYKFGGWRWSSNNSIYGTVGMDYSGIEKSIITAGEPGIFWLDNSRKYGRIKDGVNYKDKNILGTNPCVTGDTKVLTSKGLVSVENLVNKSFHAVVDNKHYLSEKGFWSTGIRDVYKIELLNGLEIKATKNHKFLDKNKEWKSISDLCVGDELSFMNHRGATWNNNNGTENEGYFIGQLIGDGTFRPDGQPIIDLWIDRKYEDPNEYKPYKYLQDWLLTLPARKDFKGLNFSSDSYSTVRKYRAKCVSLHEISNKYKVFKKEKSVPEFGSKQFTIGLLRGLFDSDGSVQGFQKKGVSIRLRQVDLDRLKAVQRLLLSLGIVSTIYKNRDEAGYRKFPDGKEYWCQAIHDLVISRDSIIEFNNIVGFYDNEKNKKLNKIISNYKRNPYKSNFFSPIVSIEHVGEEEVYDCTINTVHRYNSNGFISHNCAEISLESYELCCLNEVYPAKHTDYWDFQRTLKFAYLYTKIISLVGSHWKETNDVINRNHRIGCSQSGIQEAIQKFGRRKYLDEFCDQGYDYLQYIDKKYSDWLGVPRSIKTSTVKPSGTVSLVAGSLPGIHYAESDAYYRTVRVASSSPFIDILKKSNYRIEPAISDPVRTSVVYFPILHKKGTLSKHDISIWEQFANAADLQEYWSDNSVSITITFSKEESNQIARALSCFDSKLKSISLLPLIDHGYPQAPYITATREEVQEYKNTLLPLDFSSLTEESENIEGIKYCDTDYCEV